MTALNFLLDFFFPKRCLVCGKYGKFLCLRCQKYIRYFDRQVCAYCRQPSLSGFTHPGCRHFTPLDGLFVLAYYEGVIRETVRVIKYNSLYAAIPEVAQLLLLKFPHKFAFDYLVPIPLSRARQRERGFNQAEKLARSLPFPVAPVLIRTRNTLPQFDLQVGERQKNVSGAFSLNPQLVEKDLRGFRFCLIDDVITTGSTLVESARVLKKAGATKILAVCLARGQ